MSDFHDGPYFRSGLIQVPSITFRFSIQYGIADVTYLFSLGLLYWMAGDMAFILIHLTRETKCYPDQKAYL